MSNYGGAYDIGEYDYFTKEEIVEFAEIVAEDVSAEVGALYEVSDVYMDYSNGRQNLVVILIGDDGEYVIKHTIDMRKIRIPTDLFKAYLNVYVEDFVKDIEYWN